MDTYIENKIRRLINKVEVEINKTPTGELRNLLCDVNIMLQEQTLTVKYTEEQVISILTSVFVFASHTDRVMTIRGATYEDKAKTVIAANNATKNKSNSVISAISLFK
jgi:hypothetical protein